MTQRVSLSISPCRNACPIKRPIQRHNVLLHYLAQGIKGNLVDEKAFLTVFDEILHINPLFGVCGYVCGLCEKYCNRKQVDSHVHVRFIERFVFDWYRDKVITGALPAYRPIKPAARIEKKIAIIGGGPAGISAAFFLAKEGYGVSLFEARSRLGGALRFIPSFRLPDEILNFAIDQVISPLGIEIHLNFRPSISSLKKEGYDAILIATGTHLPRPVPPFAQGFEEVENAIDILAAISEGRLDEKKYAGKQVVVIGGSGVAIDAARSLRRYGANAALACLESSDRTSKDGILANEEDEKGGLEEGVAFYYSRGLQNIERQNGKLLLTFSRCTSVYDLKDGQKIFNPQFDPNDLITLEADYVIFGIGQLPDRDYLQELYTDDGRIDVNPHTFQVSGQNIFMAGDVFRIGYASQAINGGKEAAESIKKYLKGKNIQEENKQKYYISLKPLPYTKENIEPKPDQKPECLPVEERLHSFALEQAGFTLDQLIAETGRCLHCGGCENCKGCVTLGFRDELCKMYIIEENCDGCGFCIDVCAVGAITLKEYNSDGLVKKIAEVDTVRCRGCGICQATCPKNGCAVTGYELDRLREQVRQALI
ncbi:FAD-dependent oxidoreductase [Desulfohalobiaceae bacterium Ax17]|jgi:NADPH-dependent glutamate synthase beta subunit-like oxidoreductase/Pyruvate/2-oxoacid:ferredoxin oxidoreductase delta subunit|uniref:FAD-dependent oxidoreductase n=1 Tax=Desulfovulcanus ferrireducens TaxID=2831190 RepID=UPI00207BA556|nr:FAD-dependent oxidoreductase [Desulfovulcanus ferrireducens]MBT8763591.1 FAD-dependent oxidoreductase [Desulfovulcanus ferrireducens]